MKKWYHCACLSIMQIKKNQELKMDLWETPVLTFVLVETLLLNGSAKKMGIFPIIQFELAWKPYYLATSYQMLLGNALLLITSLPLLKVYLAICLISER